MYSFIVGTNLIAELWSLLSCDKFLIPVFIILLLGERDYDETLFNNQVERIFIDDHNVPTIK